MRDEILWAKFCENGSVEDYLKYKNSVNAVKKHTQIIENKTELNPLDKNNGTGSCDTGTEYR